MTLPRNPEIPPKEDQSGLVDQGKESTVSSGGGGATQVKKSGGDKVGDDDDDIFGMNREMPTNAAELRELLQQDIVAVITKKLEAGAMTEERAKAIAKMTLEKLPESISYEELMKIVPTLDDEFEELRSAIFPIVSDYQKKVAAKVQAQVTSLLKEKKYMEVLELTKKALEFESTLG